MTDQPAPITLNANQRRHYEVLLGRLDDSLAKIEGMLAAPPARSSLTILDDDVPEPFRRRSGSELARLRADLQQLAGILELNPRTLSLRRSIGAILTTEAVRIEDSYSAQMRGYGTVDRSVREQLDPILASLAASLRQLSALLTK